MNKQPWKTGLARAALFAAAFLTSSLLITAIGAGFHGASSQPWLRDTPEARLALARCLSRPDRPDRRSCLQAMLAEARAREAGAHRIAALGDGAATATAPPPGAR